MKRENFFSSLSTLVTITSFFDHVCNVSFDLALLPLNGARKLKRRT
jgi:hypothetical protein